MRPQSSQLSWSRGGGPGEVTLVLEDPETLRRDLESASRSLRHRKEDHIDPIELRFS